MGAERASATASTGGEGVHVRSDTGLDDWVPARYLAQPARWMDAERQRGRGANGYNHFGP